MPNNELQKLLSTRFEKYSHSTNESVWGAIESQLDSEKSDRAGIWFWIFNGIAATFFVGLLFQSSLGTNLRLNSREIQATEESMKQETREEITKTNEINEPELAEEKNSIAQPFSESESRIIDSNESENPILFQSINTTNTTNSTPAQLPVGKSTTTVLAHKNSDISRLDPKALTESFGQLTTINTLSKSTKGNERRFFHRLPIHLGFEFTYLQRIQANSDLFSGIDTGYYFANNQLRNNRHYEFNLFSQFDFTNRFSASIGVGYSNSVFDTETNQPSAQSSSNLATITSDQRVITVPIQGKFAFIRKNRFSLSAGLTFQGEFGRNVYSITEETPGVSLNTPPALAEEIAIITKQQIRQFAIEPFLQLSIGISPRISTFANLGYRKYFGQLKFETPSISKLNFIKTDVGISFQIH